MTHESSGDRTSRFRWQTREALTAHFELEHAIPAEVIEAEIEMALEGFRLRRNEPIDTRELWQKVGLAIEKRLVPQADETELIPLDEVDLQDLEKREL